MRIALVTRRFAPLIGGAEAQLAYLAPALAEYGHDVTILTSRLDVETLPSSEPRPTKRGSLVVERLATSRLRFLGTYLYMNNLRRHLEALRPDVAYVSMLKHDAYVAVEVGQRLGFPVVLRPEGAGATGDLAWQARGNFGRRIGRRTKDATAFVAISRAVESELLEAGYDKSRIHPIPNGVPVPQQSWVRRDNWRSAPRAAYVGRLSPEKGADLLVDAWPAVRESFPEARLVLMGDGPERPRLEGRVAVLGLRNCVEFAGHVADPSAALRDCDLFVLPSREEGMSVALLEALALGIPVVATSIPGNRKLVLDFKTGRLAKPDDPADLARIIVEQWTHFDRAFHLTRAGRTKIQNEYAINTIARRHLELFERLARKA